MGRLFQRLAVYHAWRQQHALSRLYYAATRRHDDCHVKCIQRILFYAVRELTSTESRTWEILRYNTSWRWMEGPTVQSIRSRARHRGAEGLGRGAVATQEYGSLGPMIGQWQTWWTSVHQAGTDQDIDDRKTALSSAIPPTFHKNGWTLVR